MITAITDAKPAVEAMKLGAADYLNKPFDVDEIRLVVERILRERSLQAEVGLLRTQLQENHRFDNIVGSGPAMQKIYTLIQRLKDTETTVLITGETGTGKELVARALHFSSTRKDGPFMAVHCAAIPGERSRVSCSATRRAVPGAHQRRIGMFGRQAARCSS
jgi:DNA-binding NtrC family response regulator